MEMLKVKQVHIQDRERIVKEKEFQLQKRTQEFLTLEKRAMEIHSFVRRTSEIMDTQRQTMSKMLTEYTFSSNKIIVSVRTLSNRPTRLRITFEDKPDYNKK